MRKTDLKIAIVGATGAVGQQMIDVLQTRRFPFSELRLFSSSRSAGRKIECGGKNWECRTLSQGCFAGIDFAFFDASDEVSKTWVPEARAAGACVIDNSGYFRMHPEIPLVVPEVNGSMIGKNPSGTLIAGPNCTTIQLVMALKPLHERFGLERVVISTYQSVSGAGILAMDELRDQTRAVLAGQSSKPKSIFPHPIAFNCIPQIGSFITDPEGEEGVTSEESKVIAETRKILGLPNLAVACTAVRVPTLHCHAESVLCEFRATPEPADARKALAAFPGIEILDSPKDRVYPTGLQGGMKDAVYVGRIRKDPSHPRGLQFWVVSDNLRKGAALNAIQIAESMLSA